MQHKNSLLEYFFDSESALTQLKTLGVDYIFSHIQLVICLVVFLLFFVFCWSLSQNAASLGGIPEILYTL